jgi:hypothetical protein
MFVYWKRRELQPRNDRSDVECLHVGPGRWSWTPIVAESVWTPAGSRRRTVLRPSPAIRSCCRQDPIVRVRWWDATADILGAAKNIDLERVISELAEWVPLPTQEEELIYRYWPHDRPWRHRRGGEAADHRAQLARTARRLAIDQLRPGDLEWEDALTAWHCADAAFERGDWAEYVRQEKEGLEFIGRAIAKAQKRAPGGAICVDAWLEAFQEHVRRLDDRRARREEEQVRRRAEEDRRRQRAAEEERRRAADEEQRRSSTRIHYSSRTQSVAERMNNGSPVDWAELLGVPFPCTPEELKRAHREAARRHHPDVGGDTEMMKAVNIAKERIEKQLEWYWRLAV